MDEVVALSFHSTILRTELFISLWEPYVLGQHVFRILSLVDRQVILDVCATAVENNTYQPGENIFQCSTLVDQAYVVAFGSIQYIYVLNLTATTREVMATQTVADHWNQDHPLMQER